MAAPGKVETVTLKDLAATLAESHGVPRSQMNGILTALAERKQEIAADALLDFAASNSGSANVQLSDAQVAEIERRMSNPKRKFMTLEESRAKLVRLSGDAD